MDILLIAIAIVLVTLAYNLWYELYEFYHQDDIKENENEN